MAYALNDLTPGTDWRKCSKSLMAEEWARRDHVFGRSSLRPVTIERLSAAISLALDGIAKQMKRQNKLREVELRSGRDC